MEIDQGEYKLLIAVVRSAERVVKTTYSPNFDKRCLRDSLAELRREFPEEYGELVNVNQVEFPYFSA